VKSGRKVVLGVAALALIVGLPFVAPPLLRPLAFFQVRQVEVRGARYLSANAVIAALGLAPDASVFDDLVRLSARLAALGGVAEASVGRRLPGTLVVVVREVEPVALAEGPDGLVPVGSDARPLPFDAAHSPVDAPLIERVDRALVGALATVQLADLALHGAIVTAALRGGEVVLELNEGRIRLPVPLDAALVRKIGAVRRDLEARAIPWLELDGRYRGWIVVRKVPDSRSRGGAA
jgi:hypothetical protein